jgi:hypothetical protein
MTITSTNTVTTDISYTVSQTTGNTQQSENDSLGYGVVYTQGTGNPSVSGYSSSQVNAQVKNTGVIPSGSTFIIDFESITKTTFNASYTLNMKEIKQFIFYNEATGTSDAVLIRATGTSAITGMFNGETGNYKVNPYGSFVYSNFYGDNDVSSTHRYLHFVNTSTGDSNTSGDINYSYILIGVTG